MIDSNNKLKSLSRALLESAQSILSEKKTVKKDLANLAPPYNKVTHADVLVGRKVFSHDDVVKHKAKKGIKEDADMVVIHAPVLGDLDGELAEVLKRDSRDKTVHVQCEGMKYILKAGQYKELDEAVKNPYAVGMAAAMKSTGDTPPLKKSTITKAHEIAKAVKEETEELDEASVADVAKTAHLHIRAGKHDSIHTAIQAAVNKHFPSSVHSSVTRKKVADQALNKIQSANKSKMANEEAEQIDELETATLKSYRTKARAQGNAIVDKMKMGGGDWSKDQKDTKTLRKRAAGANMSGKQLVKRGESLKTEEVEELDELSRDTLRRYRMKAKSIGDNEKGDIGYRSKGRELAGRKTHGGQYGIPKAKVMASEDVELSQEEIDFIEATMADLEEGRGRPPKEGSAAYKAKQQQDLADMPALGVQIRKAASINKPVTFMNGESKHLSDNHINRFHDHMDSRKTSQDKSAFQKRAHKSHDEFVKAVSEPVPGRSKDTGEIVKYR